MLPLHAPARLSWTVAPHLGAELDDFLCLALAGGKQVHVDVFGARPVETFSAVQREVGQYAQHCKRRY
jgi:hypothetical protein